MSYHIYRNGLKPLYRLRVHIDPFLTKEGYEISIKHTQSNLILKIHIPFLQISRAYLHSDRRITLFNFIDLGIHLLDAN